MASGSIGPRMLLWNKSVCWFCNRIKMLIHQTASDTCCTFISVWYAASFKGNLHSWSKLTLNCWKYYLISNFVGKHGNNISVSDKTGFWLWPLFPFSISRAPPSWFSWCNAVARLFHTKELLLTDNSDYCVTSRNLKWRCPGNIKSKIGDNHT